MPDQILTCSDCSNTFTFTEGEQTFFKDKGFNPPTRCPDCRRRRKAEKTMRTGGDDQGGGRGERGDRGGRSRDW
jgi:DNA-directed RNA polymerase subunit RPC12/RpoP